MSRRSNITVTRRTAVVGAAATTLGLTLSDWLSAQPDPPGSRPKRSEVSTQDGKKMLELYKKAVGEMRDEKKYPRYHPFSWTFQANIHDYPGDENMGQIFDLNQAKNNEERAAIASYRNLALGSSGTTRIWKTCSHFGYPPHFLTWHRMYLYFFERIVENIVGQPFAMPYWAYLPDGSGHRKLPAAFLSKTEAGQRSPLYFEARNEEFQTSGLGFGTAAEVDAGPAFRTSQLLPKGDPRTGFSSYLEGTPHGNVHVAVGTAEGMGSTRKAGRDPIFWMHHANIDRLWESWRRADFQGNSPRDSVSNSDQEWAKMWNAHEKFAFASIKGDRVEMTVAKALRASNELGTQYDRLEDLPAVMAFAEETEQRASTTLSKPASTQSPQITKKGAPVHVTMAPAVEPPVALGFASKPSTRYDLVIEVEAQGEPAAAYDVFIKVPKQAGSVEKVERLIKTFNLFGVGSHDGNHVSATWKADITDLVRQKVVNPRVPGDVIFRARYADPGVPVQIKSVRIDAR
jgi:tyrosinase